MNNDKRLSFITGLPRSGSTLLSNILNSNPNHFCTSTSCLIEIFMNIKNNWKKNELCKAEGIDKVKARMLTAMRGFLYGYFEDQFQENDVVFDKNRGWMTYTSILDEVLKYDYKMIVCVRDVKAITASFEKLHRKNGIEIDGFTNEDFALSQSPEGRAEIWLRDNALIGLPLIRLRDALRRCPEKFIIVPYHELTNQPKVVLKRIHEQLGLEDFEYNFENVEQTIFEEDIIHGWKDLHKIQGKVQSNELPGWHGIYNQEFLNSLDSRYRDINNLSTYK